MLRLRGNIKWTLCNCHKNRRRVSGQHPAITAFIDVKEPQVEWVDVSRPGGYLKMRMQPQFFTVRSKLFWGAEGHCNSSGMGLFQVDDERVVLRIWRVASDMPSKGLLTDGGKHWGRRAELKGDAPAE